MPLSLLWTTPEERSLAPRLGAETALDLQLAALARQLAPAAGDDRALLAILLNLCQDETVIRYRQDILSDWLALPALVPRFEAALTAIQTLESYLTYPDWHETALQKVAWRLSELENYVACVLLFAALLREAGDGLRSEGMIRLRQAVQAITEEAQFQQLQQELPQLMPRIRSIGSITVGINLDEDMRPTTATLLTANPYHFQASSMMSRLFPKKGDSGTTDRPLHDSRQVNTGGASFAVELRRTDSPFMPPLFRDLTLMLEDISRPVVQALKKYTALHSQFFVALKTEITFYLGAVRLIRRLEAAGLPVCVPQIAPAQERRTELAGLYNLHLALLVQGRGQPARETVVMNDARFTPDGRIFILTGPNMGGKTTYTGAVGVAQVLFQAGLHVPAVSARMSLADGIYTHFATEERPEGNTGRLGEEAQRLHAIFQQATGQSLILMNESLASTSLSEGLYLAREVVKILRVLGARAIFATHLHDLALECDRLNAETPGTSPIVSLVSLVELEERPGETTVRRTYRIVPGAPAGKSYAIELAAQYGLSYGQLLALLQERRVL
jgi:hypothetical protein